MPQGHLTLEGKEQLPTSVLEGTNRPFPPWQLQVLEDILI